jgi:hypothetical protein
VSSHRSIDNKWESQYDMVEQFLQIQTHVNMALVEGGYADEVKLLEVFKEESKVMPSR